MYIQQLYTGCLSEAAYYIESDGEAAIVDPLRDIETYINLAKERNAVIKYIFGPRNKININDEIYMNKFDILIKYIK